jgi:autotransporter strand-loop-strand O-heptosyltransferase
MPKPKIFFHTSYIGQGGYNNHAQNLAHELQKLAPLKIRNFSINPKSWKGMNDEPHNGEKYLTDTDKKLLNYQALWQHQDATKHLLDYEMYTQYPNEFDHNVNIILNECNHHFYHSVYKGPKIGYLVWESTRMDENFFNLWNTFDQLWVASKWQRQCAIEQGAKPEKVKVVPEAVDGNLFKPDPKVKLPDFDDGRFKFMHFGRWDYRKSTRELVEAFLDEFNPDEPVDLILSIDNFYAKDGLKNTEERLKHYKLDDPRLKILHFPSREDYVKYLQSGNVFLSCARSEGWNLPLIEAMACGTPSIYSNCSGQLEFAEGLGLPVKISHMEPAQRGEYSSFHRHLIRGEFYEPDFKDLRKVMRDAYENYDKHKKRALKESEIIRTKFTWANAAKIAYDTTNEFINNLPPNEIIINFDLGPKVEVTGSHSKKYKVEFINGITGKVEHSATITNKMWTKCSKAYYIPWIIKVNGKIIHKFDLTNKKVKISFDSKSIGDTLAWMPQVIEFKNTYKCDVIVSSFHNEWFEGLESYKNIEFIKPDTPFQSYAHYKIGWFKKRDKWDNGHSNKIQPNTVPLIQCATDILGLPYKEINYGVNFKPKKRPIKEKYICIGPRSTSGLKEWPYEKWRELAKKLHNLGYKIINLSYEGFEGEHIITPKDLSWPSTWNYLHHADLFIGLGSGLSWTNWALNKHTLMINNFIPKGYEFANNLTKIENKSVCHDCWVKPEYVFDAGDWDWCPEHKGTKLQHICMKSLSVNKVFNSVKRLLSVEKKEFIWITGGDEGYLKMIEVLAKSLLKYSKYKLIVYGFNCESNIELPNVINKRVNFSKKPNFTPQREQDLFDKDYSLYFAKYLASIDSLEEGYENYAWLDGDAFVTEEIDNTIKLSRNLDDYPLFMKYFHGDINQWRIINNIKLTGNYGGELSSIKGIDRNPYNTIIATGFYFYNDNCKKFFEDCLKWNEELDNQNIKIWVDDNAFSEERVANNILWGSGKNYNTLPVTWNNYYSSENEIKVNSYFLKQGFDVMYTTGDNKPIFIHGPDPSVLPKNAETLSNAFKDYQTDKLMIVAHPDDELIFGGAELIKYGPEYKVVCITNKNNKIRSNEFKTVMEKLNVGSYEMWDFQDSLEDYETSKDETSTYDLEPFKNLLSKEWKKIVTHNPIGEYGHPKHKRLFETIKKLSKKFCVFGKDTNKLPKDILKKKLELLKLYKSEQEIINQLKDKNGDWFKSNSDTNYIEYESITQYTKSLDTTKYIACYDK